MYRHTSAAAVIALVTVLTVISHGHVRHFLIGVLIVLLIIAVAVFFHGHRVVGNLWRDYQLGRGRKLADLRSRQWHPEIDNSTDGTERVLAVELRLPKVSSVWLEVLGEQVVTTGTLWGSPIVVVVFDHKDNEVCRCEDLRFNMMEWLSSVYPTDYVDAPPLASAKLTFKWINTGSNEVLASQSCTFDENGNLELTGREKVKIYRDHLRKYIKHLKQPM